MRWGLGLTVRCSDDDLVDIDVDSRVRPTTIYGNNSCVQRRKRRLERRKSPAVTVLGGILIVVISHIYIYRD